MGNVMAYSGITTKVRAMSAKLLAAEDYDTIAGLGTVTEAIEYLKDKTAYAPYVNRMGHFSVSQGKCGEDPVSVSVR